MISTFVSMAGFVSLLALFAVGAIGALVFQKNDRVANIWSSFFAITGSSGMLAFASTVLMTGRTVTFKINISAFPLFSFLFHIDMLSAFFLTVISLIAIFCSVYGIGYVKHFYGKYNIGTLGFFYNSFILGMLLVVSASNAIFFLVAWEIMSISSYFLVVYEHNDKNNVGSGLLYLAMTQVGTAFIFLVFLLLYKFTGSFDFETIRSSVGMIPSAVKNTIFILAMVGFGTKAGIVPLHIWLPSAHPAAPSHVSGLMSGVMIKTGIYMMIRIFIGMLFPIPVWWGLSVLVIGAVSALLGVLYALTEHDIKRLLAYHSIENIGIILLGLGSSLVFLSFGMMSFALLALAAALFHTLNHATFKSLLFLGAGSVIQQTHTRDMEEYGGLIKYMPQTAFFFLIGSMAISALPPFNGFFSEWVTYQSLFHGMVLLSPTAKWIFVLAAGSLAFTGGLALACFVKAFGTIFLARPRSDEVSHAKDGHISLRIGMGALAVLSLLFGLFAGPLILLFEKVGNGLAAFGNAASVVTLSRTQTITVGNGFSSVSDLGFLMFFAIAIAVSVLVVRYAINKDQKVKVGRTWDCGTELTPRMEITSAGFARSIILIFKGILKPSIQHDVEYHDSETRYLPKSRTVTLGVGDVYQEHLYQPLYAVFMKIASRVRKIQGGNMNLYILYILIALVVVLFFAL